MSRPAPKTLPFLFLILLSFAPKSRSQPNQEPQILLTIKNQWGDPPSLLSWTTSTPHCNWAGILCDAATSSVSAISLPSSDITGPIPPSICSLPNLTALHLFNNSVSGPFTSIYNCSNLLHLDLSQNLLVGPLPSDVHLLPPGLATLNLSANNLTGDIPAAIGRLPSIQHLCLDNNLFNGTVPAELGNLSTLQTLWLAYNPLPPTQIPAQFGNLTSLTELWMTSSNLIGSIPDTFGKLTNLEHLDLAENSLSGSIPHQIWELSKLQYLYLYKNSLTGNIVVNELGATGLKRIDLSINALTGSIPDDFGQLKELSVLLLYFNQLSGVIPASIGELPALSDIRLFNNSLTGQLPPELGKHSMLWNLEVDDNKLVGGLPEHLCAMGAFSSLVVSDNNLTGELPTSLASCSTLNNLQIQRNRFNGEFPAGIWSATNLTTVIAHDNDLSGELPGELPWNLTRLDISNNRFSGSVPSSGGNLLVFAANGNSFSGEIPAGLGMSQLQVLLLGGNRLTGHIPPSISSLKWLTDLNLSSNQLAGEIPASFGSLPVLTSLDLSNNQLSGYITPIGNLKLNFLNLSSNGFYGEVPQMLDNAAYDRSFLSNPGLCSSDRLSNLPACGSRFDNSGGLSPGVRYLLVALGVLFFLIAVGFVVLVARDFKRRRVARGNVACWKLTSYHSLDFTESTIIRGLIESNIIGRGGAGKVYRVLIGGRGNGAVAVKKISSCKKMEAKLEREFQSEVKILGALRHTNIIKLLCCISSADSKLLVYEYMENGCLYRWLHGDAAALRRGRGQELLNWPRRLRIAVGAAQGLCYMHHSCAPPIIHRDIKSSNILLDSEFRAQVADFGLARMLVKTGEPNTVTAAVAGSFGYMAPECAYTRKLNEKVDVYSFGVVLLELTTGREANDGGEHGSLAEWAWRHVQEGNKLVDVIDEDIRHPSYMDDIVVVLRLGLVCTGTLPSTRPTMKEVLQILLRCDQLLPGMEDKPVTEFDAAPLLQTERGSRHKMLSDNKEEDDIAASNV